MGTKKRDDIERIAKAIEADVCEALPDICQALAEASAGIGRVTTSEADLDHIIHSRLAFYGQLSRAAPSR